MNFCPINIFLWHMVGKRVEISMLGKRVEIVCEAHQVLRMHLKYQGFLNEKSDQNGQDTKCKMLPMVHLCCLKRQAKSLWQLILICTCFSALSAWKWKFQVKCALLTQSDVMGTPKSGKRLKTFLLCFFIWIYQWILLN